MTLSYDIVLDDLLAYNGYYLKTDPAYKKSIRQRVLIFWILFAVCTIFSLFVFIKSGVTSEWSFMGIISLVLALTDSWRLRRLSLKRAREQYLRPENANMFGHVEKVIDGEGFYVKFRGCESKTPWNNIIKWAETDTHFFYFTTGLTGMYIPNRAMTPEQMDELRTMFETNVSQKIKN